MLQRRHAQGKPLMKSCEAAFRSSDLLDLHVGSVVTPPPPFSLPSRRFARFPLSTRTYIHTHRPHMSEATIESQSRASRKRVNVESTKTHQTSTHNTELNHRSPERTDHGLVNIMIRRERKSGKKEKETWSRTGEQQQRASQPSSLPSNWSSILAQMIPAVQSHRFLFQGLSAFP